MQPQGKKEVVPAMLENYYYFFFSLTANLGLVLLIYLYSFHRALCGGAPGRHSNPGLADLVAGTLTTIDHRTSQ